MKFTNFSMTKNPDDNSIILNIPSGIYSKNAILKACYKYLDLACVKVDCLKKGFTVEIKPKDKNQNADLFIDQIHNDFIDFELREKISVQTKEIRDVLVNKAFSN